MVTKRRKSSHKLRIIIMLKIPTVLLFFGDSGEDERLLYAALPNFYWGRSSALFINYLWLSFTPKATIATVRPTTRNINTEVPRIFT